MLAARRAGGKVDAGARPGPTSESELSARLRRDNATREGRTRFLKHRVIFFAAELDRPAR